MMMEKCTEEEFITISSLQGLTTSENELDQLQ